MEKIKSLIVAALTTFMCLTSSMIQVHAEDTSTDDHSTTINYEVEESYKWQAPADIFFTDNIDSETKGGTVSVLENIIAGNKTLVISIGPSEEFKITSVEGVERNYQVLKDSEVLSAGSRVLLVPSGVNDGSQDLDFELQGIVSGNLAQKAGVYTGTLNFEAVLTSNYRIEYHMDGGVNDSSNPATYEKDGGDIILANPTKVGYTFEGWYLSEDYSGSAVSIIANGTEGSIDLYAKWSLTPYTISYNLNDGNVGFLNPTGYNLSQLPITLTAPTKAGYTFKGWTGSNGDTPETEVTIPTNTTGNLSYTANWELKNYTITYNLNGGSAENLVTSYDATLLPLTLDTPTKTNYVFGGWYTNADFSGEAINTITSSNIGNKTLYAKWDKKTFTIDYVLNGGTNNTSNLASYDIAALPITLYEPTKAHFTFAGWYDNASFNGSPVTKLAVGTFGDKAYYAKWVGEEFTITYHLDGGENNGNNPTTYRFDEGDITLLEPTKEGYSFKGWYTSADLSGDHVVSIVNGTTGNIDLYAKWEEANYNITLKYLDDTTEDSNIVVSSINNLPTPTRNGYTFEGWHTGSEGISSGVLTEDDFISDSTYKWTYNSTSGEWESTGNKGKNNSVSVLKSTEFDAVSGDQISFEWRSYAESSYDYAAWNIWDVNNSKWLSGASTWGTTYNDSTSGLTPDSGLATTKSKQSSSTYTTNTYTFTADGKYQIYWTYRKDSSSASGTDLAYVRNVNVPGQTVLVLDENPVSSLTDNLTLYAKWAIDNYSISWVLNEGTLSSKIDSYNIKTNYTLPIPTRTNYVFEGWYETEDFSGEKVTGIAAGTTGNKTFYAHWYDNYNINYVLNGGSNSSSNPSTYSSGKSYSLYNPSRINYVFEGWYENEDFSGTKVTSIASGSTGDKTLYAHWYDNYNISYVLNGGTNSGSAKTYYSSGSSYTLPTPTKTDYVFEGWYTTEDFSGSKVTSIAKGSTGDKTYYAKWYENYNIAYVLNGGTNPDTAKTFYSSGSSYTLPVPVREDYVFKGWYTTEDFSGDVVSTIPSGSTGDKIFYGKWYDNYSITYVLNNGVLPEDAKYFYSSGSSYALPKPTKNDYYFVGWYETEDFSTDKVRYISRGTIGNKTYYAMWADSPVLDMSDIDVTEGSTILVQGDFSTKGNLVTINGNQFRVLSISDTVAKVMMMDNYTSTRFNNSSVTTSFGGTNGQKYAGSNLDNTMTTYYNSLPSAIQDAIVEQNINQSMYQLNSGTNASGSFSAWYLNGFKMSTKSGNNYFLTRISDINVGARKVYALDVDDVIAYLGSNSTAKDVNELLWNQRNYIMPNDSTNEGRVWFRSACSKGGVYVFDVNGYNGYLHNGDTYNNRFEVRPAFVIDLSLLS